MPEILRPVFCRRCGSHDSFWKHGSYLRSVSEAGCSARIRVFRFICSACLKTVSRPWEFMVPGCRYTACVVESAIQKYILTRTSYRKIAEDLAAGDLGDELPPCHVQIFNWVKRFAEKSTRLSFKLQKELALRGLFTTIQELGLRSKCPNSHMAHTIRKASQLNGAHSTLLQYMELAGQSVNVIFGLQSYFLKQVEYCESILSGRAVTVATPHSPEHLNWNSSLDCLSGTEKGRQNIERNRSHEVGAISLCCDSAIDACKSGKSSALRFDERDNSSPTFESGWG